MVFVFSWVVPELSDSVVQIVQANDRTRGEFVARYGLRAYLRVRDLVQPRPWWLSYPRCNQLESRDLWESDTCIIAYPEVWHVLLDDKA